MRVALIPPISRINDVLRTDYQLMLPSVVQDDRYDSAYYKARKQGSYTILDNGAAEGAPVEDSYLLDIAYNFMVHEIVAPDVLLDADETLRRINQFEKFVDYRFNYMAVLQGTKWEQLTNIASSYAEKEWITTIGIPRHLIETMGEDDIRAKLVQHLNRVYPDRFKIHLLGTAPACIDELVRFWNVFDAYRVRGVDTSAPYVYAQANERLRERARVRRPKDYFQKKDIPKALAEENIRTLLNWACYVPSSS